MTNRQTKILEILTANNCMEVSALSNMLNVSQVTVRKDLDVLRNRGLVHREHGLARVDSPVDVSNRLGMNYTVKLRIARAVAQTVEDGETVMIESGSCCAILADELMNTKQNITIVTNSAFVANHVQRAHSGKIILLGGDYQRDSQVMVGALTVKCAETFFAKKFFIGTDGFSSRLGFTGRDHVRAETIQGLARQASRLIVLTESEKFSQHGAVGVVTAENVSRVYTDDRIPLPAETLLLQKNVQVHKVESA